MYEEDVDAERFYATYDRIKADEARLMHSLIQAHRAELYHKAATATNIQGHAAEMQEIYLRTSGELYYRIAAERGLEFADAVVWRAADIYRILLSKY